MSRLSPEGPHREYFRFRVSCSALICSCGVKAALGKKSTVGVAASQRNYIYKHRLWARGGSLPPDLDG